MCKKEVLDNLVYKKGDPEYRKWHYGCFMETQQKTAVKTVEDVLQPKVPEPSGLPLAAVGELYDTLMDAFSILSDTIKETNLILKSIEQAIRGQGP